MDFISRPAVHLLVIVLLTVAAYAATFDVPFQLDDLDNIVKNPAIKSFDYFRDMNGAGQGESGEEFDRPLFRTRYIGYFTFALNYAFNGLDVRGYHAFNLLIHLGAALLVYGLVVTTFATPFFRRSDGENPPGPSPRLIAFFTALLFAVHPVQTQAVTYIVQRFASMATMLCLLSLLCYVRFRIVAGGEGSLTGRVLLYGGSLISAILAMKTKEFSLLIPLLALLYEIFFLGGTVRERLTPLVPLFLAVLVVPLSLVTQTASELGSAAAKISGAYGSISSHDYLATQFRVIVTYLRLLFVPAGLRFDYDYPIYRSFLAPEVVASLLLLLVICLLGAYLYRRSSVSQGEERCLYRLVSFGIFWFFLALSGESGFVPIADVIFEHRLYFPSFGFFLAIASGVELARGRLAGCTALLAKAPVPVMLLAALALAVATHFRNEDWRDPVAFMERDARLSPGKARPHLCLGRMYGEQRRLAEAMDRFDRVLAINPRDPEAYYGMGLTLMRMNRMQEAEASFRQSIALRGGFAPVHANLGALYSRTERYNEALEQYYIALLIDPRVVETRNNLANTLSRLGRAEEAVAEFGRILGIKPDFAEAHYNLGNVLLRLGRREEALEAYRLAVRFKPDLEPALRRLDSLTGPTP